ncbi:MAG TPA: DegT/DnrJ/EryC1/StrS family aminotransferase [Gammaproteobacteria bacterium]|nr:DegT/DnrJ/EryC1/StrS family aminotransferase [Gammaproteobacteria bacterium]
MIPFVDAGAPYRDLKEQLDAAYHRVMRSGRYVLGPEVEAFEARFAGYCEATACVGVGSGLDALELILRAHDIGPGDEVIVPAHTFIATWLSVSRVGATPVPVEPDADTFNIRADLVEERISGKTRAIIAVHLYGQPADMDELADLARRHGLFLFEDAAQAHGARYRGRRTGGLADAAAFSFYPVKNLGAFGDAGAVVTNNPEIAEKVRMLGNYGSREKYHHEFRGSNSRLDELQAALLLELIPHLDQWNARRSIIATAYLEKLSGLEPLALPMVARHVEPVWHQFVIRHPQRDELSAQLEKKGIQTLIHYPVPPHQSGAYADGEMRVRSLPVTEQLCKTIISLPIGPYMENRDLHEVIQAVQATCR